MFALGTTYHSVPLRSPANISEVLVHILEESVCSSVTISLFICFSASPLLSFSSFLFHHIVSTLSPATNIRGMRGDINYSISGSLLIVCCNLNKSAHTWLQQQQEEETDVQVTSPEGFHLKHKPAQLTTTTGPHFSESKMWKKNSPLSLEINNEWIFFFLQSYPLQSVDHNQVLKAAVGVSTAIKTHLREEKIMTDLIKISEQSFPLPIWMHYWCFWSRASGEGLYKLPNARKDLSLSFTLPVQRQGKWQAFTRETLHITFNLDSKVDSGYIGESKNCGKSSQRYMWEKLLEDFSQI